MNIEKEVAQLRRMTVDELRQRYAEVMGESTNGRHKQWLIKRIAWRLQARHEGGLSERALKRAAELADEADLRMTAPRSARSVHPPEIEPAPRSPQLPPAGTVLTRVYKGETVRIRVLADGFEFEGERFRSLSAVARAITGSHWSGLRFFGLPQGKRS